MTEQQPTTTSATDDLVRFKTYVVYLTAAAAVLGGLAVITYLMIAKLVTPEVGIPVLVLVVGGGVQFLFAELQSKRTEQAIERANLVARSTVNGYIPAPSAPVPPPPAPEPAVPGSSDPEAPAASP